MITEENKREMELWKKDRKNFDLQWPDENVVRYLNKNFKTGDNKVIVDFACGSGRNTIVMAKMGFDIYAVDYNMDCLLLTKEKIDKLQYSKIQYIQNERTDIPLSPESSDCLVAWGALFYVNGKERTELFKEIYRVLKPGGLFLADYRTKEDSHYGRGREIEKDLFVLNDSVGNLKGINYWFCGESEIRELYANNNFEILNIEKREMYVDNMAVKNSHWQIWARKL
ncbi:class I SAM-dependent methyltransferase [Paenibacillus puldeungensis]|uniref:Class I SAM-dependent methyltransferase n=1 Tax=Paenibacillus puldeungensis TaxID=696536 RepID=A0ABW3S2N6_9BACL